MPSIVFIFTAACVTRAISERALRNQVPYPVLAPSSHLRQQPVSDIGGAGALVPGLQLESDISQEELGKTELAASALINGTRAKPDLQESDYVRLPAGASTGFALNSGHPDVNWTMTIPQRVAKARRDAFEEHLGSKQSAERFNRLMAKSWEPFAWLTALGGGTGASIGGTGSSLVDRDLLRRMHYQDKAVMLLVLVVYLVALLFSANLTYRQASNNFPVTYYADPRFHNLVMEGHDLDIFLESFNQAPKNISLKVAGFVPVPEELGGNVRWRGENFQVAFTFSLDLSPWVVRETQTTMETPYDPSVQQTRSLHNGVLPEDRSSLQYYLDSDQNDLSYVEVVKKVVWPQWEELATNIKHQIRQAGFQGVISVDRVECDELQVYKNKPWANFMHARATRVLCALSIVGWIAYVPYMWLRCTCQTVRSHYRVDVGIAEYWPLIADKLTADGFQDTSGVPPRAGRSGSAPAPTPASGGGAPA